jgi:hypothetical protein
MSPVPGARRDLSPQSWDYECHVIIPLVFSIICLFMARLFVAGKAFQSNLIFVGEARRHPSEWGIASSKILDSTLKVKSTNLTKLSFMTVTPDIRIKST